MSTKEQIYSIIDSFSDEQLTYVYEILVNVKKLLDSVNNTAPNYSSSEIK